MRKDIYEAIFMENKQNGKINFAGIAKKYNCDYRTVKRYFNARDQSPNIRKTRNIPRLTDGLEEIITRKYLEDMAPAIAIYHFLKEKYSFKGSYTTIKTFTHNLKEQKIQEATLRFETNPGLQSQVDWKESMKLMSRKGEIFIINIFLTILGFSRLKYIELTLDKTQPTMLKCLTNSFKYFGGVPKEILFDNMRSVVDRSRTQFNKPIYNQTFYQYCKDAGFIPMSCIAFRPRTKGKVEVLAKIMDRLKVFNNEFDNIDDLFEIIKKLNFEINSEVQQTTKEIPFERFKKEKEYLNHEPNYEILETYFSTKPIARKVPKDSMICFQNHKYSVPPKYIGKIVHIRWEGSNLSIYYNGNFICTHKISDKIFNYIPSHYEEIAKRCISDNDLIREICEKNLNIFDKLGGPK